MTETVGYLKVYTVTPLGRGQFGTIFRGSFKKTTEVDISCVDKGEFFVDVEVLSKTKNHNNILHLFCVEETQQFK